MDSDLHIESAAISDRGLNDKRPENEDSFLVIEASGIFAVADGVGGAQAGEVASQMAVEILGEAFANRQPSSNPEQVMHDALSQANAAIHHMSSDVPQLARMATTIVALHVGNGVATIGHVGDSRLYRLDEAGTLHRETDDHSVVAEEVRAGRMTEEQAEDHPSKNIISRALGAEEYVEIDLQTRLVQPGSTFLLCSDGVTRHIGDSEIAELLSQSGPADKICSEVKRICFERGAEDNLTAIVVRIAEEPKTAATSKRLVKRETNFLAIPELDEATVAGRRRAKGDDLLDLWPAAETPLDFGAKDETTADLALTSTTTDVSETEKETQTDDSRDEASSPIPDQSMAPGMASSKSEMGDHGSHFMIDDMRSDRGKASGLFTSAFALLLGLLIGALGTYLLLSPPAGSGISQPAGDAGRVPLSGFEERRRDVDKDPSTYLSRNGTPDDAEDFYLIGRAYLLSGDYPKARAAFVESRSRLSQADPSNSKVLAADLAVLMAVTNDTTVQTSLRSELDGAVRGANANTNSNSTR